MTMQIRTAAGNSRKWETKEVLRKYQSSGNYQIMKTQTWHMFGLRSYKNTETWLGNTSPWTDRMRDWIILMIKNNKINKCLPLCIIQFQVAFLDALADCIEWQWFSKVLLSPCGYVHHGSRTVSQTIPPVDSIFFELTDHFLTEFGKKWWTMTHPCLQRLSLCWMLLLYSILITSPVTS